ncbi:MAG: Uma2 family endonuclease [Leptolyngbyaceae cyanobacterium CAN_BIN12]|nr:Uma2 family endonuclease [Leptolyngbyaceae cyanobacterium CAN_BIN12]
MYEPKLQDPNLPPRPEAILPTMYDLPSEDPEEPGLPDEFHQFQPQLLRETCHPPTYPADQIFIGTDLNLYYDSRQPQWHKRPDWFLVLGVPRAQTLQDLRLSYVIWIEGVVPFLLVELLSPGTEAEDLGQTLREVNQPPTKWQTYEQVLRVPYYVIFDRYQNQLRVFQLVGTRYQEMTVQDQRVWFEDIDLGVGVWQGTYQDAEGLWLRWYDAANQWIPTPAERAKQESQRAEQERQRAEQERQRAEQERQRADRLAAKLRELGIDPEQI